MDCSPPGSSALEFSRQEYWSGFPFPSSGDLPNLGIELASLTSPELAGGFFTTRATWEFYIYKYMKVVLVAQLCLTLYYPMDCSPPSSSVHRIFQARILEWVSIPFPPGIFPIEGWNLCLPHCRQILYRLSHQGRPFFDSGGKILFCWNKRLKQHCPIKISCICIAQYGGHQPRVAATERLRSG